MRDLSLHILDLLDNSLAASARTIVVRVSEDGELDLLTVEIEDDGAGMDPQTVARAADPFFTSRPGKRTGMGLPLFGQAAREAGGEMTVDSGPGRGTRVRATFGLHHPDRKPLGDLEGTLSAMRAAHPEVEIKLERTAVVGRRGGSL